MFWSRHSREGKEAKKGRVSEKVFSMWEEFWYNESRLQEMEMNHHGPKKGFELSAHITAINEEARCKALQ